MFYLMFCVCYTRCKGIVRVVNIVFLLVGLAMLGLSSYLYRSKWRYLIADELVEFVLAVSCLQTVLSAWGWWGVSRVDDHHEQRTRNWPLFTYACLVTAAISVQLYTFSLSVQKAVNLTETCASAGQSCDAFSVQRLVECCPDEWREIQSAGDCCGWDTGDAYAHNALLNSTCAGPTADGGRSGAFAAPDALMAKAVAPLSSLSPAAVSVYLQKRRALYASAVVPQTQMALGAGAEPEPGCRSTVVNGVAQFMIVYAFFLSFIAGCQVACAIGAFCLTTCKFHHHTVEGFRRDGTEYGVLGFGSEDRLPIERDAGAEPCCCCSCCH